MAALHDVLREKTLAWKTSSWALDEFSTLGEILENHTNAPPSDIDALMAIYPDGEVPIPHVTPLAEQTDFYVEYLGEDQHWHRYQIIFADGDVIPYDQMKAAREFAAGERTEP